MNVEGFQTQSDFGKNEYIYNVPNRKSISAENEFRRRPIPKWFSPKWM